jgi:hypothetical protein
MKSVPDRRVRRERRGEIKMGRRITSSDLSELVGTARELDERLECLMNQLNFHEVYLAPEASDTLDWRLRALKERIYMFIDMFLVEISSEEEQEDRE